MHYSLSFVWVKFVIIIFCHCVLDELVMSTLQQPFATVPFYKLIIVFLYSIHIYIYLQRTPQANSPQPLLDWPVSHLLLCPHLPAELPHETRQYLMKLCHPELQYSIPAVVQSDLASPSAFPGISLLNTCGYVTSWSFYSFSLTFREERLV